MINVSIVSYLNSKPFAYGIENSVLRSKIHLSYDPPSVCASKLLNGSIDIGLVPIAILPELKYGKIISDYCISADGYVESVLLLSLVPLKEITKIILDGESRTSVMLAKILAKDYWDIDPEWTIENGNDGILIEDNTAAVVIGDRALAIREKYQYIYDLSAEWKRMTSLPFVFACWVANKDLDTDFAREFNNVLATGVNNIDKVAKEEELSESSVNYLKNVIKYKLDERGKNAITLFLEKLKIVSN